MNTLSLHVGMIERQSRNVAWAIIDKGPFQLHPSLRHFILPTEVWLSMPENEKESYVKMVMKSSVAETVAEVSNDDQESTMLASFPACPASEYSLSPLDMLANAACTMSESSAVHDGTDTDKSKMSMTFSEFQAYLHGQPQETQRGMWDKAVQFVCSPGKMSPAPGCAPSSRIVASHRFKDRPHLVTKGKANGEYRCEKSCPHWNGMKICSHTIATAESNGELKNFLAWHKCKRSNKPINLSAVVHTDMPLNPGRKGGVPVTSRRTAPKLPVQARMKRTYSTSSTSSTSVVPNTNPFYMKKMNMRIRICQGCRGPLRSANGKIQPPPFDYCVARKERRSYRDESGELCTPSRLSDSHYHLRAACIKSEEQSFVPSSLIIPEDIELTLCHQAYVTQEFGLSFA